MEKGQSAELTEEKVKEILTGKSYVKDGTPGDKNFTTKDGNYIIEYTTLYEMSSTEFSPETFKLGTPVPETIEKYGYIVNGYNKTTEEYTSGIWKLFYQDSGYTYLIIDNPIGVYTPYYYYESETKEDGELKYKTGADVGIIGQKLNKMLLDNGNFFIEENENINIRATAWFTDIDADIWKQYKNDDAVFAIGAPTLELYKTSFDATGNINNSTKFDLEVGEDGYITETSNEQLKTEYNYGIYNNAEKNPHSTKIIWWMASPMNDSNFNYSVHGRGYFYDSDVYGYEINGIRPVVCIPTAVFNAKYASTMVEPNE